MTPELLVCAPLRVEARALSGVLGRDIVRHTGYGPRRSARSATRLAALEFDALAVTGLAGGLAPAVRSGDVVVGSEIRGADGVGRRLPYPRLADEISRQGLTVHTGPIVTVGHVVYGTERAELARTGALAVDMESAELATLAADRPLAVVRVVLDTPHEPLVNIATVRRTITALRHLRSIGEPLARWAASAGQRCTKDSTRPHAPTEVS